MAIKSFVVIPKRNYNVGLGGSMNLYSLSCYEDGMSPQPEWLSDIWVAPRLLHSTVIIIYEKQIVFSTDFQHRFNQFWLGT